MEHARLDRAQHLGHEPEEPEIRGAIALRPVAAELRLLRLHRAPVPTSACSGPRPCALTRRALVSSAAACPLPSAAATHLPRLSPGIGPRHL